jgi:hypothetical protein
MYGHSESLVIDKNKGLDIFDVEIKCHRLVARRFEDTKGR